VTSFVVLSFLADTNHWDSGEFTLLRGNCTRAGDMIEDCLKAASFATSCGGLSLPFAVSFFFWSASRKEVVIYPVVKLGKARALGSGKHVPSETDKSE